MIQLLFHMNLIWGALCIVDSGICLNHELFKNKIVKVKDFTNSKKGVKSVHSHGCSVSGVAVLNGARRLLVAKSIGDNGLGYASRSARAIDWCVNSGATVVNLSWGRTKKSKYTSEAIKRAIAKGVRVVASAGNRGPRGKCSYPGLLPGVINAGEPGSWFTSGRCKIDEHRKCTKIKTTKNRRRGYIRISGTSFCAPQVAAELVNENNL